MKAIKAYTQIYGDINGQEILRKIEACGRVCYKSEDKITGQQVYYSCHYR